MNTSSTDSTHDKTVSSSATNPMFLAADVGGTNARFALASGAVPISEAVTLATGDYADAAALLDAALLALGVRSESSVKPAACAVAVAGPVADGMGTLTNGVLTFDARELSDLVGAPVAVVNDFYAVASAIPTVSDVQAIGRLKEPCAGVRAVLGPGTGLGMAFLTPPIAAATGGASRWQVFSSEGGNADFAPADELELELLGIVRRSQESEFSNVSIETLVSGRGLPHLYRALCELWGARPEHSTAQQISEAAIALTDTVSHKSLELFCGMLGSAAGNFALTVGARGGVYLAGGILPKIKDFFYASDFRRRFDDRGALSSYNQQIPVFLVLDAEPGLNGAVSIAQSLLVEGAAP